MAKAKDMTATGSVRPGASSYDRLESRLVLLGWLHRLLGYGSTPEMLQDVKEAEEGFGADGRSHIYRRLASRRLPEKIKADLAEYDSNICAHLEAINAGRHEPVTLKNFQYMAVLYTEIFLDRYFNRRDELLSSLNEWVAKCNTKRPPSGRRHMQFTEIDLRKLAFWMATGSGKTLIMHFNYRQFLRYNKDPLDNILLITPNVGLSKQHLADLYDSNIPAARYRKNGGPETDRNTIQVIEITKPAAGKRGKGVSVPVDVFEGSNLIFVDEGHKGSGGQVWRSVRDTLGENGFTFEYSATFGQALAAAKDDELVTEYGKAIAFDYSYRHFYNDGYGKDFHIVNLQQETSEGQADMLLLANLLSFYEQQLIFAEHGEELRLYNLERPLLTFVGGSVNATYMKGGKIHSDVLTVVRFLHRLLADGKWATESIGRLLKGESGLKDADKKDIFRDRFPYLGGHQTNATIAYGGILRKVLHTESGGGLHLCDIRNGAGELGLRAAGSQSYFGLINIGDDNKFRKLVESDGVDITIEQDPITPGSLFASINNPDTTVEILIGAKKFMEGWNSWRVSAMGLLNIGRSEGSQIIQLFGRGVRLRGSSMSLKRSSALGKDHPQYLRQLETLNIFALRAKYMDQFRDDLEREGAAVHERVEIQLPIRLNREHLGRGLVVLRLPEGASFADEALLLKIDQAVKVLVNLSPKIDLLASSKDGIVDTSVVPSDGQSIPKDSLDLVDMPDIYAELLKRKEISGWHNMAITSDAPETILRSDRYLIVADSSVLDPQSFADMRLLQEAATAATIKYAERFYHVRQERWERNNLSYRMLDENHPNFQDYTVTILDDEERLVSDVQNLIKESDRIYGEESDILPNVHFDRHLYLPLLLAQGDKIKTHPPGLNKGEEEFVKDLRKYCIGERDGALGGKELFLLRNLDRGKGIGFFQNRGFYPDFILWVKSGDAQRIVFVEPHGMFYADAPECDEKVQLHSKMRDLTEKLGRRPGMVAVTLDSYIVSETPFEVLARRYGGIWDRRRFAEEHILFPERNAGYDYLAEIVRGSDPQ